MMSEHGCDDGHHQHEAAAPAITNMPHQHAMVLVGEKAIFAVHMTQYHHEEHKYQLVWKVGLPPAVAETLARHRRQAPADCFVLSNDASDPFIVPEIASGRRPKFKANLFQGLPPFDERDEANPHFFPWSLDRVEPLCESFEAVVERVVTFRPFAHHLTLPDFATYLIFGQEGEAHLTSLQTAHLATGPFEVPAFGPDYDHVQSLQAAPAWLDPKLLEAGVVVTIPSVRLRDPVSELPRLPCSPPFASGSSIEVLYRGIGPTFNVVAGECFLFGAAVCTSPSLQPCSPEQGLYISPTPSGMVKKH
jgi:hypothetical protein